MNFASASLAAISCGTGNGEQFGQFHAESHRYVGIL